MKKIIFLMLMVLGLNQTLFAQAKKAPTSEEIAKKSVDDLEKRLKLNETQKSVIYMYTLNQVKQQAELIKKQQTGGFQESDVDKYYKIQNEANSSIRNVLKDEQQVEFDRVIEERLSGIRKDNKKKKKKSDEPEVVSDIKGLLSAPPLQNQN